MDFILPPLSATMESAKVLRWFKQAGDRVLAGEPLVEVETDKASMEIEAPADGTLTAIAAPEGATVPAGARLATLEVAGGAAAPAAAPMPAAAPVLAAAPATKPAAVTATPAASAAPVVPRPAPPASGVAPRVLASPLAKRLAAEHGLDLSRLTGTGPNRRIRKRDVLAAAAGRGPAVARAPSSVPSPAVALGDSRSGEAMSAMRLRVAETVSASRRTIPAFSLDRWVDAASLHQARESLGQSVERESGVRTTVTDFLLQAMADALRGHRAILDRWVETDTGPRRVASPTIDVGLVVALDEGMMIPVLRDLGDKSLAEIARMRRDAVARVRAGRLIPSDTQPAAIALSNLGTGGADRFDAIINPGQSSILAVGREHERVVARGGWPVVAKGFHLTLSVDHRLIDGVRGARFIGALAERIEFGPWS